MHGERCAGETVKNDDRYLQCAIGAAKEAGRIQMAHLNRFYGVEYKDEFNPVTEVDRLCEQAIVQGILRDFPDHDILTEESPFQGKGSPWRWIVDPLDGTTNYLHGFPFFCVSIGLEVEGEVRLGVVFIPTLDELFYAEKGKGAYLNGNRISVSRTGDLNKSFLCTGFPYDVRDHVDFYLSFFRGFLTRCFALRRPGSAAIDLCYLAAGRFDGFWELKLHAWDVAAGSLMITEAGGQVTAFDGQSFSIYAENILASNGSIHKAMRRVIADIQSNQI